MNSFAPEPGLLTVPQNKFNGYIQATYPEFQVQAGDRLQTLVNCEFGATSCYVTFRIDYILPNGVQKTFWSWKEAYDKRFYRANLDLSSACRTKSPLRLHAALERAGKRGPRHLGIAAHRPHRDATQPPAPPATLTALPPLTPTATPITPPPPTPGPAGCDRATFVTDVTVQDGTIFAPGAAFTKTWRLKNTGSCIWTTAYKLVYYSGEQMSAPTTVNLPWGAVHDQTVDISVNMVAPSTAGALSRLLDPCQRKWKVLRHWCECIRPDLGGDQVSRVIRRPMEALMISWQNACSAEWKSGAGALPCPGTDGDSRGFVIALNPAKLEDGSANTPGIVDRPAESLQRLYPGFLSHLSPSSPATISQSNVGCEYGSSSCYVTFRLDYMAANGYIGTFWQWTRAERWQILRRRRGPDSAGREKRALYPDHARNRNCHE